MRLLNVDTLTLQKFSASGSAPPYAILSHTWLDEELEVSLQDLHDLETAQLKEGFEKIHLTCAQAKEDGLEWAWIDTCCIDKSSSHEFSEAINSMYQWYKNARMCYVYLADVPGNSPPLSDEYVPPSHLRFVEAFEESRWFTRGWTLQELIAPRRVLFYGESWNCIGALNPDLLHRVSGITGVQSDILDGSRPLSDLSVARRLSWAAKRETTRVEDQAYSLFGILDVNMPLLYGEGKRAFQRLQEQIILQSTDQSIFAWDSPSGFLESQELLLAPSPSCFANCGKIRRRRGTASEAAFRISNKGVEIELPVIRRRLHDDPSQPQTLLGILDCKYEGSQEILALVMSQHPFNVHGGSRAVEVYISGFEQRLGNTTQYARLIPLRPSDVMDATSTALTITKDLRSRTYIQDFSTNEMSWFPIRFSGDERKPLSLHDVYPEHCWSETQKTLRLRSPHYACGGIVVDTKYDKWVLIVFGIDTSQPLVPARKIYDMIYISCDCPIEPHLRAMMRQQGSNGAGRHGLRLSKDERLVARLWQGALTVSIEAVADCASPSLASPPTSPTLSRRSFSSISTRRKDSFIQDTRSEHSDSSQEDGEYRNQWTPECPHCQRLRARERAEQSRRRQKARDEAAEKQKTEKQQKMRTRAKQAGVGLSIGTLFADFADIDLL